MAKKGTTSSGAQLIKVSACSGVTMWTAFILRLRSFCSLIGRTSPMYRRSQFGELT
jgi:hypothetical protein